MNEIDLKKTPLSEIDLSKIDYEKSYVEVKHLNNICDLGILGIMYDDGFYKANDRLDNVHHFKKNGQYRHGNEKTLHLFYKEEKRCGNCDNLIPFGGYGIGMCNHQETCNNQSHWQPKESVSQHSKCIWDSSDKHPIIIEYQDLGDKVKILKIEGVMTFEEIEKHAGFHVLNQYASGCCMRMENSDDFTIRCIDGVIRFYKPSVNQGMPKQEFDYLIESMKLSAKRLAELIKESKKPEIKRIVI